MKVIDYRNFLEAVKALPLSASKSDVLTLLRMMPILDQEDLPIVKETDSLLIVNGHRFRCECGANVFHKGGKQGLWICNACGTEYVNEKYVSEDSKNKLLNEEYLRSIMDTEELVDFIEYASSESCSLCEKRDSNCAGEKCREAMIKWLRMPYKYK